jgi:flagella basal body P-ring formation protein FlgA
MGKSLLLLLMLVSSLHAAGCISIEGDEIRGRDLAHGDLAFAALNPELYVSYAPAIGNQRAIAPQELAAVARANGISYTPHGSVCFVRSSFTLTAADAAAKIRDAFGTRGGGVQVDVLEVCKCSLPAGTLQFSLRGASLPPLGHSDTPSLWRGQLISKSGMSYPVWVRARVLAKLTLVRAKENIRPQAIIERNQVEEVVATESPLRFTGTQSAAEYIGKLATRSILEGYYLDPQIVRVPPDIIRGEVVKVDVIDGPTHLQLDARAETSGKAGDRVTLINPSGLHKFQATISGPGRAQIVLSPTETETSAENKGAPAATTSRRIL